MPIAERPVATVLHAQLWWDFARLTMQSFAIGLAASLLLGLAVFAVA